MNALRDTQKEGPESGGFFDGSIREEAPQFIDDGLPTKLVKEAAGDESREGWRGIGAPADGGGTLLPRKVAESIEEVSGGGFQWSSWTRQGGAVMQR